jgi:hypothetical protein
MSAAALLCVFICSTCLLAGCYEELDWREWRSPDAGFVVLMPDKPKETSRELEIGGQRLNLHMVFASFDGVAFGAAYADVAPDAAPTLLSDARDALTKNILGTVASEQVVELGGAKGIEFHVRGEPGGTGMTMSARVLRDEHRFYQIVAVGKEGRMKAADADLFLRSFKPLR